jgi:uncharacterized protein (DUF302 family)
MHNAAKIVATPFHGIRVEADTPVAFDEVLSRLRKSMGNTSVPAIEALAKRPISQAEYIEEIERGFVGPSGFMLFAEINHGGWLPKFGINRRTVRWILGNPLIAITMIRHDITAGLFAPVEILVTEKEDKNGTIISYVRPSTLMVIAENKALLDAATSLDTKLDALVSKASAV